MKIIVEKLKGWFTGRAGWSLALTALIIAAVMFFNAIAYALTVNFNWYLYQPETVEDPISGNTDYLFDDYIARGKQVTVTFCQGESEVKNDSTGSFVYETAKALEERHPSFIKLRFVNYITRRDADGNPVDLEKYTKDMRGADTVVNASSVIFTSGDSYRVITGSAYSPFFTLDSKGQVYAYNGEEVMASMICWVMEREHKTVYFTMNHTETMDPAFTNLLTCAGYYLDVIDVRKNEIPSDADMLMICNPTSDFQRAEEGSSARGELDRIEDYLERGGSLYVSYDPLAKRLPLLESFLEERGIGIAGDTNADGVYERDLIKDLEAAIPTDVYTFVATHSDSIVGNTVKTNMSGFGNGRILASRMGRLELSGTAMPVLVSSPSSVAFRGGEQTDSEGSYPIVAYNEFKAAEGKTAKILVSSGSSLTSAATLVTNGYSNKDFTYSVMSALFDSSVAPYGCKCIEFSSDVLDGLTIGTARLYTALVMAIPAVIGIFGAVILIRRRYR